MEGGGGEQALHSVFLPRSCKAGIFSLNVSFHGESTNKMFFIQFHDSMQVHFNEF